VTNLKKYISSAAAVLLVTILGNLLSFVKEAVFAAWFGVSIQADAYIVAIQIPVVLFAIFAVAINTVVIPLYSEKLYKEDETQANIFANNLLTIIIIGSILFSFMGIVFADYIVYLFAPGFDITSHNLAVNLVRIIFPSVVFTATIDAYRGILNVHKIYIAPSLAIYLQNIVIILFIIMLTPLWGIYSAIIGTLFGILIQFFYVYLLTRRRLKYKFYLDLKDQQTIKAGKMLLPVMLGIGVAQINQIVNRIVASYLTVGSIAALNYASKLTNVFSGLIIHAVSIIVYPLYAEQAAKNNQQELSRIYNYILSIYTITILPIICGLIIYRQELVEIAFARGAFDTGAVELTQYIFGFYAIGLLFLAIRETTAKVYYSMGDTQTPMINSAIGVLINIVLNIILAKKLGAAGLALATSISALIICVLLMFNLKKKIKGYKLNTFALAFKKSFVASVVMVLAVIIINEHLALKNDYLVVLCGSIAGIIIYAVALLLLRTKEFLNVLGLLGVGRK
jgi:putative peptidoglycan lipid II flippase